MRVDAEKLRVVERAVSRIAESMVRADATASKSFTFVTSKEIDLGRKGGGEVEFAVRVSVSIETSLARIKSVDWYVGDDNKPTRDYPVAEVQAHIERHIASSAGQAEALEAVTERL